jgi:PAS domain-containing protein
VSAHSDRAPTREQTDLPIDQRMAKFLDALPVGVFIALPGGRPAYVNPEAVRLLGRGIIPSASSEELSEVYQVNIRGTPDPYPTERLPVVAALNGRASNCDDMDVRHPDGTIVPIQAWGTPVTGLTGSVEHAIVAFADVSERTRAEEALRATRERFLASVEILPDGIAILSAVRDGDGHIQDLRYEYINQAGYRTYQRTREEILGHTMVELFLSR